MGRKGMSNALRCDSWCVDAVAVRWLLHLLIVFLIWSCRITAPIHVFCFLKKFYFQSCNYLILCVPIMCEYFPPLFFFYIFLPLFLFSVFAWCFHTSGLKVYKLLCLLILSCSIIVWLTEYSWCIYSTSHQ